MPRPPGLLKPETVEAVLGYLKAAALRGADVFSRSAAKPEARLGTLDKELAKMPAEFRHLVLGDWVVSNLTAEGRTRMLATLRRRRADAKPGAPKAGNVRLPTDTLRLVQAVAKQTGMPVTLALYTLAFIAQNDKDLRGQMVKLGVALKTG